MKEKIAVLNEAANAYYNENRETMSNIEYDRLYDELVQLEAETGVVLSGSPTVRVGYEVMEELPKERHETRMLSLDKTKDIDALKEWLAGYEGLLAWKLDGLTVILTYADGKLQKAVTRGNGEIGEVITSNAKVFANIPHVISFKGELVVRGEAIIRYSDFEKINESIEDAFAKYKNPRNLCSGSVRQLNNQITAERNVRFYAFSIVKAESRDDLQVSRKAQMEWLDAQGFEIVGYRMVTQDTIEDAVKWFADHVAKSDMPSDGLVLAFDDIAYGKSLGNTAKFPRDSIAFKWRDELKETTLEEIEWSASRTGLINPIAIFAPVELEGTTVSRASVHNISIMKELQLGIGDTITVYKANMIIPQIAENLTKSGNIAIPETCPVCDGSVEIKSESGIETLICTNEDCPAKQIKMIAHFVERNAMNIEGLSEATIEKLIAKGIIKEPADLFHLKEHKEDIVIMEGFGEKSFHNLVDSVDRCRKTSASRLLYALGIPNIGVANARNICKSCGQDWDKIQSLSKEELLEINGIGDIMAEAYVRYFNSEIIKESVQRILAEIEFEKADTANTSLLFDGKIFVITGALEHFDNREALSEIIEQNGGKTTSSVTSKTSYLINNDLKSNSSKNKKAKELGVPIISEAHFVEWLQSGNEENAHA
ncbi:MAG: NAD-dependent DNA ligase LigA [Clostridiales bacterium]|nr:NAD-dependent DNA ligase LigA [Clostridiales bacterium]